MKKFEMPIGFEMALAQNPQAMQRFALFSDEKKQEVIDGTNAIHSKEEMHQYVNNIISNE